MFFGLARQVLARFVWLAFWRDLFSPGLATLNPKRYGILGAAA